MSKLVIALTTIESGLDRDKGGPTRVIFNLLRENKKRKDDVELRGVFGRQIVTSYDEKEEKIEVSKKVNNFVNYLRNKQILVLIVGCFRFIRMFRKFCSKNKILLVNAHDVFSGALYLLLFKNKINAPLILSIHSKGSYLKRELNTLKIIKRLILPLERFVVLNADLITFPSRAAFIYFCEDIPEVKMIKRKIAIVHNGICVDDVFIGNESSYCINKIFEKIGNKKIILSVTPFVKEKGVDILINSFLRLDNELQQSLFLIIVGDGPEYKNLKSKFTNATNILHTKKLKHKEVILLMKKSTIFVLPHRVSIFDYVLLEAMLCRLPIITTPRGGNLEIFSDVNSVYFVPAENTEKLREAMEYLIKNEEKRKSIANNAYNLVIKEFSLSKMYENYKSLYYQMLN